MRQRALFTAIVSWKKTVSHLSPPFGETTLTHHKSSAIQDDKGGFAAVWWKWVISTTTAKTEACLLNVLMLEYGFLYSRQTVEQHKISVSTEIIHLLVFSCSFNRQNIQKQPHTFQFTTTGTATNSAPSLIGDYCRGLLALLLNWRGLFAAAVASRPSARRGLHPPYSLIPLA